MVENRFDTLDLIQIMNKRDQVIRLIKDELGRKIMTKFVGLRVKTYSYLIDDSSKDRRTKGTKSVS